jgi:hypothetical protein
VQQESNAPPSGRSCGARRNDAAGADGTPPGVPGSGELTAPGVLATGIPRQLDPRVAELLGGHSATPNPGAPVAACSHETARRQLTGAGWAGPSASGLCAWSSMDGIPYGLLWTFRPWPLRPLGSRGLGQCLPVHCECFARSDRQKVAVKPLPSPDGSHSPRSLARMVCSSRLSSSVSTRR